MINGKVHTNTINLYDCLITNIKQIIISVFFKFKFDDSAEDYPIIIITEIKYVKF